jgi:hypothetical protein
MADNDDFTSLENIDPFEHEDDSEVNKILEEDFKESTVDHGLDEEPDPGEESIIIDTNNLDLNEDLKDFSEDHTQTKTTSELKSAIEQQDLDDSFSNKSFTLNTDHDVENFLSTTLESDISDFQTEDEQSPESDENIFGEQDDFSFDSENPEESEPEQEPEPEEESKVIPLNEVFTPDIRPVDPSPKEDFQEVKDFGESIAYSDVQVPGNPPYSILVKGIQYEEDAVEILEVLKDFAIADDSNQSNFQDMISKGQLLVSQINEYVAIQLAIKLRKFDVDILSGLSEEVHPSKTYEQEHKGLITKSNIKQNRYEHLKSPTPSIPPPMIATFA